MDTSINPYQAPEHSSDPEDEVEADEQPRPTFHSARNWGIAACLGIASNLILAMAAIGVSFALLSLYDVDAVEQIDPAREQALLFWLNAGFIPMIVVRLVTAIAFMVWMYRVYVNLLALGHAAVDWKPWMAPLCWLIPFFNLVAPCLVMREILWRSDPRAEELGKNHPALQTVHLWWAAWIAGIVLSWIGNRLGFAASTLADHVLVTRCDVATSAVLVVCGILAIWLILCIDAMQMRRHTALLQPEAQFPAT